jgi:hypothetical protein
VQLAKRQSNGGDKPSQRARHHQLRYTSPRSPLTAPTMGSFTDLLVSNRQPLLQHSANVHRVAAGTMAGSLEKHVMSFSRCTVLLQTCMHYHCAYSTLQG